MGKKNHLYNVRNRFVLMKIKFFGCGEYNLSSNKYTFSIVFSKRFEYYLDLR